MKVSGALMKYGVGLFLAMNDRSDKNMVPLRDGATTGEVMGRMQA